VEYDWQPSPYLLGRMLPSLMITVGMNHVICEPDVSVTTA